MSKAKQLAGAIAGLFPKSNRTISEKLSTEEYNEFSEDASELNERLAAQGIGNEQLVANLKAATDQLAAATASLEAAEKQMLEVSVQLEKAQAEATTYKTHYEKAKQAGAVLPETDENSKGVAMSSYNEHAVNIFKKSQA